MSIENLRSKFNELTLISADHWDYRGTSKSARDFVHGLCTYPAMMVPKMQREILDVCVSQIEKNAPRLLDPFAGSGTILVEGMLKGLDIVGIDVNPLAVLLCKAKTTIIDPNILNEHVIALKSLIVQSNKKEVNLHNFNGIEKWFTNKAIRDLSIIRNAIMKDKDITIRRFFWAAFCEIVRMVSNSRDCTYKLHIKEKSDIDNYDKDALELFSSTLDMNVKKYISFHAALKDKNLLRNNGSAYKHSVSVVLADATSYLNHSKKKYDLIITSPPYGDNHTTVSYGQYSVMPLRWIDCYDIDESVDDEVISTLCAIDNVSLGGKSSKKSITAKRKKVISKSITLKKQCDDIEVAANKQLNKLIAFYSDYDLFLKSISKKMSPGAISVWTLGNRKIAKKEIYMDKIMMELSEFYGLSFVTSFTRRIINKRMPEINAYTGSDNDQQTTMTTEHILVLVKEGANE